MNKIIYELECSLLSTPTRHSYEKLNSLIADGFFEFGSSGTIYSKDEVLKSLPKEDAKNYIAYDFRTIDLTPEIILATYRVTVDEKSSLRSSIWKLNAEGQWQIIFHQGTPCR